MFKFSWVDMNKDPDGIAFSLGLDTLEREFFPVLLLINNESVYIAPKKATQSYHNIAEFIEGGYKTEALAVWPIQKRVGSLGFASKWVYRRFVGFL